ncbi:MAG: hypothetical protein ACHQ1G_04075 [Planctomycetota bacterium]
MTEDEIARQAFALLQEFVDRIRRRLPGARGGAAFHGVDIHGKRQPYASFAYAGDDELVLAVLLQRTAAGLTCDADVCAQSLLIEMPMWTCRDTEDPSQVAALLANVREFAASQEDRVIDLLRRDAAGFTPPEP